MSIFKIREGYGNKIAAYNFDGSYIQECIHDAPKLELFQILSANLAGDASNFVKTLGIAQTYIKVLYSNTTDSCGFYINYYDGNGVVAFSDSVDALNTQIEDPNHAGKYIGELIIIDVAVWSAVNVVLNTSASALVTVYGAATKLDNIVTTL